MVQKIGKQRSAISIMVEDDVSHCSPLPLSNNNLASTHGQKFLCGSQGTTNHMLRGPGGILPPCALDNRHADLCPGCGPCCGCSPSQPWLGAPGEHRLSPSPTDEEAFVEVQVSSKEVGVLEQQQKNAFGHIREGKRNSMTLSTSPPPQGGAPQCQVRLSRPVIAPVG